jgi:hypothetical protein
VTNFKTGELRQNDLTQDQTYGLLGDWDDDMSNDLRRSDGEIIDPNSSPKEIHERFGMSCQSIKQNNTTPQIIKFAFSTTGEIKIDESRFLYRAQKDWHWYRDPDFVPSFEEPMPPIWPPPGSNYTEGDVQEVCGDEFVCRFDFKTTMNKELGQESMHTHEWTQEMAKMTTPGGFVKGSMTHVLTFLRLPVHTCGRPEVDHAIFEYDEYLVGGTVEFTGCEPGYTLRGEKIFRCETSEEPVTAEWQPSLDNVECKCKLQIYSLDYKHNIFLIS